MSNALWAAAGRDVFGFDLRGASEGGAMLVREATVSLRDVCAPGDDGDDEISSLHLQPRGGNLVAAADDAGAIHLLEICSERLAANNTSNDGLVDGSDPSTTATTTAGSSSSPSRMRVDRFGCLTGGHNSVVTGAFFHPTMTRSVVSGALDASLAMWDLSKLTPAASSSSAVATGGKKKGASTRALSWSHTVASAEASDGGGEDGRLASGGGASSAQSFNPPLVQALAVHGSGKYFAAGLGDSSVALHAFAHPSSSSSSGGSKLEPTLVRRLVGGHSAAVAAVHFAAHDEDLLLSAGNDKRIAFWHLAPMLEAQKAAASGAGSVGRGGVEGAATGGGGRGVTSRGSAKGANKKNKKKNKKADQGSQSSMVDALQSLSLEGGGGEEENQQCAEAMLDEEGTEAGAARQIFLSGDTKGDRAKDVDDDDPGAPYARLVHGEKVNWMASSHSTSFVFLADVSPAITAFDVSRV